MKFNYNEEFDLLAIYKKLTSSSKPTMVKACDFFEQKDDNNLVRLQAVVERMLSYTTCVK